MLSHTSSPNPFIISLKLTLPESYTFVKCLFNQRGNPLGLFIGARSGAGTTFGNDITVGVVSITIILNDQTLVHSANLV